MILAIPEILPMVDQSCQYICHYCLKYKDIYSIVCNNIVPYLKCNEKSWNCFSDINNGVC